MFWWPGSLAVLLRGESATRTNPAVINAAFRQRRPWDAIPGEVFHVHQWWTLSAPGAGLEPATCGLLIRRLYRNQPKLRAARQRQCGRSLGYPGVVLSTSPARARTAANHAADHRLTATRDALQQAGFGETRNQNQGNAKCDAFHLGGSVFIGSVVNGCQCSLRAAGGSSSLSRRRHQGCHPRPGFCPSSESSRLRRCSIQCSRRTNQG